jgi:hypothetical protein
VPRFYFHVIEVASDRTFRDDAGEAFAGREAAMAHAAMMLHELTAEFEEGSAFCIDVMNEHGQSIGVIASRA